MGACYSIEFLYKFKNDEKAKKTLQDFVRNTKANFHLDTFKAEGIDVTSVKGLIQVVLAGYKRTPYKDVKEIDGFRLATNDFNASYGWETLLMDFFEALAPYLEDGSRIYIEPDDDWSEYVIENGIVKQTH